MGGSQRRFQVSYEIEVVPDGFRVQGYDVGNLLDACQFGFEAALFGAQRRQQSRRLILGDKAFHQQIDCAVDFSRHRSQLSFQGSAAIGAVRIESPPFFVVRFQVSGNCTLIGQPFTKARQYDPLNVVKVEDAPIGAGAGLDATAAVNARAAVVVILDDQAAAAASAFEQTGQQVADRLQARPVPLRAVIYPRLHRLEEVGRNDGQVRDSDALPKLGVVGAG